MMLVIYLASLIRSVIALHSLIENKEQRALHERERAAAEADKARGGKSGEGGKASKDKEAEKDGEKAGGDEGKGAEGEGLENGSAAKEEEKENKK